MTHGRNLARGHGFVHTPAVTGLSLGARAAPPPAPPRPADPPVYVHHAGRYERYLKPLIDRCISAFLLLLFLPVMAMIALAVLLALGAPFIIRQPRVGKDGRVFSMLKFRTMHTDRRASAAGWWTGPDRRICHKRDDDPRLVPLGRFLRRWSLDELPQLINVLVGHMSLVGPRPELEGVVAQRYKPWQLARHQVKPGLTGLWQVSARGQGIMHDHIDRDIEYMRTLSARRDLDILLRTPLAALGVHKGR